MEQSHERRVPCSCPRALSASTSIINDRKLGTNHAFSPSFHHPPLRPDWLVALDVRKVSDRVAPTMAVDTLGLPHTGIPASNGKQNRIWAAFSSFCSMPSLSNHASTFVMSECSPITFRFTFVRPSIASTYIHSCNLSVMGIVKQSYSSKHR